MSSYCSCLDHRRSCEDESSRGIYELNFDSNKFKVSLKVITLWVELKLHFVTRYDTVLCRLIAYGAHFKLGLLEKAFVGNFCLLFIYLFIYLFIIIYSSTVCLFILFITFCLVIRCSKQPGLPLYTNKCPGEYPSTFLVDLARKEGSWTGEEEIRIQFRRVRTKDSRGRRESKGTSLITIS